MKITVEDCLKLKAFSGCKILSCKSKKDRRVRSVSVLDEDNPDKGVERNGVKEQMVITHFWNSKDDVDAQVRAVSGLGKKEIAALVVYLNEDGIKEIDSRVIKAAKETDLVLISISDEGVTYSMLIEQVLDKILYGNNYSDNILNNTISHLLNFDKNSSFPVALREAAIFNNYQVVLMTEEFNPILTIETRNSVTIDNAIQTARKKNALHSDSFTKIVIDNVVTYWGYINIERKKYILVIVDNKDNYSETEMKKLAEIIELAIGMWKYTPERDSRAEFVKSAIRGDLSFCYTLIEEADLKSKQFNSVFCVKNINEDDFYNMLEEYQNKYKFKIMMRNDPEGIFGIIYDDIDLEKGTQNKVACIDFFESLKAGRRESRIFHITGIETLDEAVEGFRLISKTRNDVEKVFPYKRVFTKYEMSMVYDTSIIISNASAQKKVYLDLLEPFSREVSDNKGKLLLDTLATFLLDAGMNSNKTAELMEIHNNTVQYRLKKINEILGAEITGNRIIPGLTMSLAIKRLEEK